MRGTAVDEYREYLNRKSPIERLPPLIGEAVDEVQRNIQAPLDLVIASALGAISLACQDKIDVQRGPNNLISPCSLFFLTIAASGDRKSTVDRHFTDPIAEFERDKEEDYRKQMKAYGSKLEIWKEKRKEIKSQIRKASREGAECEAFELKLMELDQEEPSHPKRRKLIYTDATPESIVYGLYRDWPSAAILSDEAGGILNGRAMNDLGMLNQIWDGSSLSVDRRSSESFTLNGARLTISLMTQEKSLRKFIERNDGMARDIGFLARCLVSNPVSMQGKREITYISNVNTNNTEKLDEFKRRLKYILNENFNDEFQIDQSNKVMQLSSDAYRVWVDYFNEIESELKFEGRFASVKDAASKIADNAARMAAIFHYFEGRSGDVSERSMNEAVWTCNSYLGNFLDLFGEYGLFSPEKHSVDKLVGWFKLKIDQTTGDVILKKNDIRQNGPIRNSYQLDKALDYLNKKYAVSLQTGSYPNRTEMVELNPRHAIFKDKNQSFEMVV